MKRLGIIGGVSWVSTALYYEAINRGVGERVGGFTSAPLLIHSLNFADVAERQKADDWDGLGRLMHGAATDLSRAGAEGLLVGSNTMHKTVPSVRAAGLPVLHVADAIAQEANRNRWSRIGVLGTRITMRERFWRDAIEHHGIETVVPSERAQREINTMIFTELVKSKVSEATRQRGAEIIAGLAAQGCEAVVLGCTELGVPAWHERVDVPLIDSQAVHAKAAVDWILGDEAR